MDRFATLLTSPPGFNTFQFTYLHGISAEDVYHSPSWSQISQKVAQFRTSPVFAHNASFDAGVWKALDDFYAFARRCRMTSTAHTAPRKAWCRALRTTSYRPLPRLWFPATNLDHHRAESDAGGVRADRGGVGQDLAGPQLSSALRRDWMAVISVIVRSVALE